jgi:hypothetical protein
MDYHKTLLHFIVLHGSHNGDSISKHIMEILKQYDIHNKLTTVTANNVAPNIRFLCLLLDQLHQKGIKWDHELGGIPCLTYVIQLSAYNFLNVLKAAPENKEVDHQLNDSQINSISNEISFGNTLQKVPNILILII